MANQSAANVWAAIKEESAIGVAAPGGAGAEQLRLIDSPGLGQERQMIRSGERRRDLIRNLGRAGARSNNGTYNLELTVGGAVDMLMAALLRNNPVAAAALWTSTGAGAQVSLQATATDQITFAGTDTPITAGLRVGDLVRLGGMTNAANNKTVQVVGISGSVATFAGTPFTVEGAASTTATLTRQKKIITAPAGGHVMRSFTVEQYDADIDEAELFIGERVVSLGISLRPNGIVTLAWGFQGLNRQILEPAQTPYFTDPAVTTGLPLIADDSTVRYKGSPIVTLTGMDINLTINATVTHTIGSPTPPDVFLNEIELGGSITAIRTDLQALRDADDEAEFDISLALFEPGTDPKPASAFYIPRVKIGAPSAPFMGGDGPKIETRPLEFGPRDAASGFDVSAFNYYSTGA